MFLSWSVEYRCEDHHVIVNINCDTVSGWCLSILPDNGVYSGDQGPGPGSWSTCRDTTRALQGASKQPVQHCLKLTVASQADTVLPSIVLSDRTNILITNILFTGKCWINTIFFLKASCQTFFEGSSLSQTVTNEK